MQILKALYSVPTRYIGKVLDARADHSSVRLYLGTELIKAHPRKAAGQRSTDPTDFPPGKAPWALRDVDAVGLLRLCNRYGHDRVNALCARALAFVLHVPCSLRVR